VIASGAFGLGVSDAAGLLGSEEQPAINPAVRIAKNSFFICIEDLMFTLSVEVWTSNLSV